MKNTNISKMNPKKHAIVSPSAFIIFTYFLCIYSFLSDSTFVPLGGKT